MSAFLKRNRPAGWRKGPPKGGEIPANLFFMNGIEIFIDESGDFGPYSEHCPYYVVTMVFHDRVESLYDKLRDLEYRLQVLGLENHCVHSSPAIRGEDEYFGVELALRRKVIANLMAFAHSASFKYRCFFSLKTATSTEASLVADLHQQIDSFVTENFERLAAYSDVTVCYDSGQKQISKLLVDTLATRFSAVRMTRTLPIQSRLSQVADLVCTMKRIARRLSETGNLARPESYFFGGAKNFRKNWIKSILRNEWK